MVTAKSSIFTLSGRPPSARGATGWGRRPRLAWRTGTWPGCRLSPCGFLVPVLG
jgi:hypothetical protein